MSLTTNCSPSDVAAVIRYDPDTGKLFWKKRSANMFPSRPHRTPDGAANIWNAKYAGKEALTGNGARGLKQGTLLGYPAKAHRVAWAVHHGEWPDEIDHIDGDPANNKVENLRSVPHLENGKNQKLYISNKSGVSGVAWYKPNGKWLARIGSPSSPTYRHLGYFADKFDAILARLTAEKTYEYHENHGQRS